MRDPEQQRIALECLKLACSFEAIGEVERAREYLAFVTGSDTAGAEARLELVRAAIDG